MLSTLTTNQLCGDCLGATERKPEGLYCENCGDYCEDSFFVVEKNRPDLEFADADDTVSFFSNYSTSNALEITRKTTCRKRDFLAIILKNDIFNGSFEDFFEEYVTENADDVQEQLVCEEYDYLREIVRIGSDC